MDLGIELGLGLQLDLDMTLALDWNKMWPRLKVLVGLVFIAQLRVERGNLARFLGGPRKETDNLLDLKKYTWGIWTGFIGYLAWYLLLP